MKQWKVYWIATLLIIGGLMANMQDVARILGQGKNPQEQRVIHEYLSGLETPQAAFTGGGTISVERLEARTGAWLVDYPFEGVKLYKDDNTQSISNGSYTDVTFSDVQYQIYNKYKMFDLDASTTTITIQTSGIYVIAGGVRFEQNGTGMREVRIETSLASPNQYMGYNSIPGIAGVATALIFFETMEMDKGTTIKLEVWQNSGGDLVIDDPHISVFRVK